MGLNGLISFIASATIYALCIQFGIIKLPATFDEMLPVLGLTEETFYSWGNIVCQYAWVRAAMGLGASNAGIGYFFIVMPTLFLIDVINI